MSKPSLRRFRLNSLRPRKRPRNRRQGLAAREIERGAVFERLEPRVLLSAVALDPTFGEGGVVQTDLLGSLHDAAAEVLRQPDGKLIVVGESRRSVGLFFTATRYNADGSLDTSFGDGGRVVTSFQSAAQSVGGAVLDAAGRIIIGGPTRTGVALLRLHADGSTDTSFGADGWSVHDFGSRSTTWGDMKLHGGDLFITASHGTLVTSSDVLVVRVNDDGSLDSGFGNGGWVATNLRLADLGRTILPDDNGITVVAETDLAEPGTLNPAILRYNPDGTLDTTFANGGVSTFYLSNQTRPFDAVRTPDGGLLITGSIFINAFTDLVVIKTDVAGALDTGFNGTGWRNYNLDPNGTIDEGRSISFTGEHIMVAGSYARLTNQRTVAVRLTQAGELDGGFGVGGAAESLPGGFTSSFVAPDGSFAAVGQSAGDLLVARYNSSGDFDPTFAGDGSFVADVLGSQDQHLTAAAVQADGKIVAVGQHTIGTSNDGWLIVRYNENGTLDTSFGGGAGWVSVDFDGLPIATDVAIDAMQRIVVTGTGSGFLATAVRLNADGSMDSTFGGDGIVTTDTNPPNSTGGSAKSQAVAIDSDGRIVVAGAVNGHMGVFRYLEDGSLDGSFGPGGLGYTAIDASAATANDLVIDADGRIVVTGNFVVARFTPAGAADTTFGGGDGWTRAEFTFSSRESNAVAIDSLGRIVLGGYAQPANTGIGDIRFALARFDATGALDASFGPGGTVISSQMPRSLATDILIDAQDNILALGRITQLPTAFAIARYLPDGQLDASFDGEDGVSVHEFGSGSGRAMFDAQGRVVLAGRATATAGSGQHHDLTLVRWTIAPAAPDHPIGDNISIETDEDTSFAGQATARDPQGQPLVFSLAEAPSHGAVEILADGSFIYTPAANYNGLDRFTFIASDGTFNSLPASVTIDVLPVNDAPVAADDVYTTLHDVEIDTNLPGVRGNDSDVEGSTLTVTRLTSPLNGSLSLGANGWMIYRPNLGFVGTDSFTYSVSDGLLTSNVATVTIHVTNNVPVANDVAVQINEETQAVIAPLVADADGEALTIQLLQAPQHGTVLWLSLDDLYVYRPAFNYSGPDSFSYRATDGVSFSEPATVTIDVLPLNDNPIATGNQYSVLHDTPLTVNAPGILGNDGDVDGDPLTLALVQTTTHGTLALNDDGSFSYLPNEKFAGVDTFTYRVNDGQVNSSTATVTINVTNQAPVLFGKAIGTNEDAVINSFIAGADADGDALTYELVGVPSLGELNFSADGSFTYTPALNFDGTISFSVRATDGIAYSLNRFVSMTFAPLNDAPVAAADSHELRQDAVLIVIDPAAGVLANDSDVDGDALTASLNTPAAHGDVTVNLDGTFTYVPDLGFFGTDTFSYFADDGARTSVATVTLNVARFAAPSGLVAAVSGADVTLNWLDNGSGYTDGYVIERAAKPKGKNSTPSFQQVGITSSPTFTDTGVASGTWLYRVKAFDGDYFSASSTTLQVSIGGKKSGGGGGGGNGGGKPGKRNSTLLTESAMEDQWSSQQTTGGTSFDSDPTVDLLSLVQSGVTIEVKAKKK